MAKQQVVQTEDKAFVRDIHSKALLNTDTQALERNRMARAKTQEHQRLKREVECLRVAYESVDAKLNFIISEIEKSSICIKR